MPFAVSAGTVAAIGAGVSAATGNPGTIMGAGKAGQGAGQAQQDLAQQRNDLAPYREAGLAPLQAQQDLLGLNGPGAADTAMANYRTSPGYQWQMGEGLRAVDAGAAASGDLRSGAALKAEQTFGAGLADSDFTSYYNRLMGLSTLGANAAAGGAQTAGTAAGLAQGAGNTQGSVYSNLGSGLGNTVNSLFSNKGFTSMLSGSGSGGNPLSSWTSSNAGNPDYAGVI